ncbi:MAG: double-strand break repair helicase AddA [Rhodobacteraceae bacterium]|nr:double-strand break repair helicase AddA [Paracoccaceae bacterium]
MTRDAATERQVQAADPGSSTWLAANAGSGKTRVLTDRVARLLLQGVSPQHILCLTYTKAAASEMQNRLFKRLGAWAMTPDEDLREDLRTLGVEGTIDREALAHARRLFAMAIETPGGLKIQTIHSFCASLLRRFPLEAGVSPQFTEMDDRAARLLREDIVEEMAQQAPEAMQGLARVYTGEDFARLTEEIVKHSAGFAEERTDAVFRALFGLSPEDSEDRLLARVFLGSERALLDALIPALKASGSNDSKAGETLAAIGTFDFAALKELEGLFLYGPKTKSPFGAKIGAFPTKGLQKTIGPLLPELEAFMLRVESARADRIALQAVRRMAALHGFGRDFLRRYEERKLLRGWLDFDDLIAKAEKLLTDPAVAQWVLFRLDGGIDHILVDEAQDTSPAQWRVIERLAQEFSAGEGAREEVERTIFVVGDPKQSIYSFQGADPAGFGRMRAFFKDRLAGAGKPFQTLPLEYSFRSSEAVLRLVDLTFREHGRAGLGGETLHRAFNDQMPGRVDLWPVEEKIADAEPGDWFDPVDSVSESHHTVRLAARIADEIHRLITTRHPVRDRKGKVHPAQAGDFLILVQRRSELFQEIIRACKARGLPIAGADRLKLGAELAVKDLTALLNFLALPEDSLSLAAVLKSPLFGWDEARLYDLAQGRKSRYLWRALQDGEKDFPDTVKILDDLRKSADYLRPYDLLERILTRHGGREKLLARLGPEAEDGIDAMLHQALGYERMDVPSLTGFLTWLETEEIEVKRQLDSAGDRIRVMTVHGAKGLESPIVILPDAGQRRLMDRNQILALEGGVALKGSADEAPPVMAEALERLKVQQEEENQRLLYVAMTRAESWLIVCAAGDLNKGGNTWYQMIEAGMQAAGAVSHEFASGPGLRYGVGDWPATPGEDAEPGRARPDLPEWALVAPSPVAKAPRTLAPSDLGGEKALPGEAALDQEAAMRRGRQLHRLLEHLPLQDPATWADFARDLLAFGEDGANEDEVADLLAEAAGVLQSDGLSTLFAPGTLAEVQISAELPELGGRILGAIDRLVVAPDHVLAVDFKSNAVLPNRPEDVPSGILRQMGAYAAALAQIYPGRKIETAILWTRDASLMKLPHDLVTAALCDAATA